MTEYIYGDILFIINFSMDFVALFICGKLMRFRMNAWRMALASTMGGVYGVAALFIAVGATATLLIDVLVAASLCFVAHYHGSVGRTLFVTGIFGAVSMLIGGAMTALYSRIGKYQYYVSIGGAVSTVFGEIPLWLVCIACGGIGFYNVFLAKGFTKKASRKNLQNTYNLGWRAIRALRFRGFGKLRGRADNGQSGSFYFAYYSVCYERRKCKAAFLQCGKRGRYGGYAHSLYSC